VGVRGVGLAGYPLPPVSRTLHFLNVQYLYITNDIVMKAQDKYMYDSAILGLNGIYRTVAEDSFFINSPCILAENQIITTGLTYILFGSPIGFSVELNTVKLIDVYYDGALNLIILDMATGIRYTITHCLECGEIPCNWMLIDIDFFLKCLEGVKYGIK
jgi:hypothetical protein